MGKRAFVGHRRFFRAENRKGDDVVVKEVNKKTRKIR